MDSFYIVHGVLITLKQYGRLFGKKLRKNIEAARSIDTNPEDMYVEYKDDDNDVKGTWLEPFGESLNMGKARPLEYLLTNISPYVHFVKNDEGECLEIIIGKRFETETPRLSIIKLNNEFEKSGLPDEVWNMIDKCKLKVKENGATWNGTSTAVSVHFLAE